MKKTVLITGTSSGIGRATAYHFHEKGWNVAATMRNPEKEKELHKLKNVQCFQLDVADAKSIQKAIQQTIQYFGRIDVIVNNAGYTLTGPFEGATADQIKSMYDVVVFGVMNVVREVLPHFREVQKGTIVNVTSLGGLIGMPYSSFYISAKWAVEGFSESLRFELEKLNIKTKIVEPGAIKTNFASNAIIVRKTDVPSYEAAMERRLANYEKRREKLSDPMVVAEVIYKAATDTSGRLRYRAGNDAKLFYRLHKILPFPVFTSLLRKMAG